MKDVRLAGLAAASIIVLSLTACGKPAATPSEPASEAPAATAVAEEPAALPAQEAEVVIAPPPPQAIVARYPAIADADAFDRRMSAGEGSAWRSGSDRYWRADDGSMRVVRSAPDGERVYYYRPGAQDPYLVRQGGDFFTFLNGAIAAVLDSQGRREDVAPDVRDRRTHDFTADARDVHQRADQDWKQRQAAGAPDHANPGAPDRGAAPQGPGPAGHDGPTPPGPQSGDHGPANNHAGPAPAPTPPDRAAGRSRTHPNCETKPGQPAPQGCEGPDSRQGGGPRH